MTETDELKQEIKKLKAENTPTFKERDFPFVAPKKTCTSTAIKPS